MGNINVLPTDKEPIKGDLLLRHIWKNDPKLECISWWRYNETITIDGVTQYTTLNGSFRDITSAFKTQNIYITSDEEIKEGDWVIFNGLEIVKYTYSKNEEYIFSKPLLSSINHYFSYFKKIILTTDQDLIKDGVQVIDDEFLEWFVKNPTYEEVYIIKQYKQVNQDNPLHKGSTALTFSHYEIHLLKATKQMIDEWNLIYCKLKSRQIPTKEEPKQETLEEVAKIWVHNRFTKQIKDEDIYASESSIVQSHILFAKWQQEKSYSEEEVLEFTQTMIMQYKFGNTNIEQMDLLKETLQLFKNK